VAWTACPKPTLLQIGDNGEAGWYGDLRRSPESGRLRCPTGLRAIFLEAALNQPSLRVMSSYGEVHGQPPMLPI